MADTQKQYTFEERTQEISQKTGKTATVCKTSRYEKSKLKAIEMIKDGKYALDESDFWILKNESKDGSTIYYTGLIITHNACLKINSKLSRDRQFKPSCVTVDKEGYGGSLVYTYICDDQGIYEVGEVSQANCRNAYLNCMALKRLQDRVILKLSALAEAGIYSEDESDDFKESLPDRPDTSAGKASATASAVQNQHSSPNPSKTSKPTTQSGLRKTSPGYGKSIETIRISKEQAAEIMKACDEHGLTYKSLCVALKVNRIEEIRAVDFNKCMERLNATPYYGKNNAKAG